MKIELIDNKKVILDTGSSKKEIHPFWLRERVWKVNIWIRNTTKII